MSPDGYITITGRIKDLIIRGGENIHPLEIENCLLTCPGVADVSVVGVPDERYGEVVAAFIICKEQDRRTVAEDKIRDWVRERLSNHLGKNLLSFLFSGKTSFIPQYANQNQLADSSEIRFFPFTFRFFPQDCERQSSEVQAEGDCHQDSERAEQC